jgi:hypothetical protein
LSTTSSSRSSISELTLEGGANDPLDSCRTISAALVPDTAVRPVSIR